jgi:menaquinone-9 beta-reductase
MIRTTTDLVGIYVWQDSRSDRMVHRTDVFVIGGGPAGLAAAIAARRKGFRVMLADGSRPPIDKACGEGLMPDALAALRELGVAVNTSEGHIVRGVRFVGRMSEVSASFPAGSGIGMRRRVLHEKLVERASACGASLLWNTPVTGICEEGVRLGGDFVSAKWLVGADGIGSRVRKWAGMDGRMGRDFRYAVRRHYRMAPWTEFMEIHWGNHAQAYVTPVNRDEVCVVLVSRERGTDFDSLEAEFPKLARRLDLGKIASSDRGAITMMRRFDRVCAANVALVGDASGSVDAITGEGLCLGFQQATALAECLEAGDLGRYQAVHRRLARRPAVMGHLMLLLDGHDWLRERTIRVLESDATIFSRLLAVHVGARSQAHLATAGALLGWRFVAA